MAAHIASLESRHDQAACGHCHDSGRLGESPAAAQHANITEILDRYASSPAASARSPRSLDSSRCGGTAPTPQQSKKRRVDDQDSDPHSPSHMILRTSQLQLGQMIDHELATGSAQPSHTDDAVAAAASDPDMLDSHSTPYQTLLQMSQAYKTRATQLRSQGGVIIPDIINFAHDMPPSMRPVGRDESLYFAPYSLGNGSTAVDAGFPDALLELVDWDISLENCDSMNWNWTNHGQ